MMLKELYGRWMVRWETALTTRDENRVVRPLEWGFEWLDDFIDAAGLRGKVERAKGNESAAEAAMMVRRTGKTRSRIAAKITATKIF